MRAYLCDHSGRKLIATGSERDCRRAAARALGVDNLRGLAQAPTERGVRIYGRGADDHCGESVELAY